MVYWSPHYPSKSKVAGSNPSLGSPFSIFFPPKTRQDLKKSMAMRGWAKYKSRVKNNQLYHDRANDVLAFPRSSCPFCDNFRSLWDSKTFSSFFVFLLDTDHINGFPRSCDITKWGQIEKISSFKIVTCTGLQ